jgi:uncharacterized protein (DUF2147 family)
MMIVLPALAVAAAVQPDVVVGRWRTEVRNGIVEIIRCGPSICGRVVDSDGLKANPNLQDVHNKDAAQRGRKVKGLQILQGFAWKSGAWTGGTIYNADDGGTYKATVTPDGADRLRMKGCIVWPLCKTQTWTRLR